MIIWKASEADTAKTSVNDCGWCLQRDRAWRSLYHAMLQEGGMERLQYGLMSSIPPAPAANACERAADFTLQS